MKLFIPTIGEFAFKDSQSNYNVTSDFKSALTELFHGNLAPILLLTSDEVRKVYGFGENLNKRTRRQLSVFRLNFRPDNQRLVVRATRLYGSIEATPIQALLVIPKSWDDSVCDMPREHNTALQEIVVRDASLKIGRFLADQTHSTEDKLLAFMHEHHWSPGSYELKVLSSSLIDGLTYWQKEHDLRQKRIAQ